MGNLYIWFASVTERRDFVLQLLEIPELAEQNGTTKKEREKLEDLALHLDLLDAGKTKSPYYNLHKRYYNARISRYERQTFTQPWDLPVVFMKGLRQLYTQNSYAFRPGKWLVLQFRATKEAAKLYRWVVHQIPKERIGRSIPLPKSYFARKNVEWAKELFAPNHPIKLATLQKMYTRLLRAKVEAPELFKGKTVYLWEQLAFAFNYYGQIKQAEKCLRIQAGLQPKESDAFLNLGVLLAEGGFYAEAIAAYREGLRRTPHCEYLNYNLAQLATFLGREDLAQTAINQAILANPSRGLNLFAKGELCLEKKQYEAAAQYFRQAFALSEDENWRTLRIDCLRNLGLAYLKLDELDQAKETLTQAIALDPDCASSYRLLGECYRELGEEWLARLNLRKAQQLAN